MAWPTDPLTVEVSIALDADPTDPASWTWTDVTSHTRSTAGITITRGRSEEQGPATPSTCTLVFDNTDGRFVPRNPLGAYYGQLGRNTPVRVRVNPGTGLVTRFTGFISEWPPQWDVSGNDQWVSIRADGLLRRLQQGQTPLRSAMFRAIQSSGPVRHWSGEDDTTALSISEASGGAAMTLSGTAPTFASSGADGSDPVLSLANGTVLIGTTPTRTATGTWSVACLVNVPSAVGAPTAVINWNTTGTLPRWRLVLAPGSPDTLSIQAYDGSGTLQVNTAANFATNAVDEPYGRWLVLTATATQNGADIDYSVNTHDADGATGALGTASSFTAGYVNRVTVQADATLVDTLMGHIGVWDLDVESALDFTSIDGYTGERAQNRATRLCDEALVPFDPSGVASLLTMGPQGSKTLTDLLLEAEAACQGTLYEQVDGYLTLKVLDDAERQAVDLTLDYSAGDVVAPLEPTDDDQRTRNDVTVTREGGSSGRAIQTTGPLGTVAIGTYDEALTINMESDDFAVQYASWRVALGTIDETRFPHIHLNLRKSTGLTASWTACDIWSRIALTNLPANISYDDPDLILEGYTEYLNHYDWLVELNCAPYRPYKVFQVASDSGDTSEFLGRLAEDENCAIRAAINSSTTSVAFDPNFYRWTTTADDFPMTVRFGGETATVSSIATTAATFVAAGAASHADNAAVTPALYAGNTTQDLILVLAAIRSSGTGTLVKPTGYTRLPVWASTDNVQLYAKVHSGSESNPTVTPSGGAAGDTVSAVTFGLRGMPVSLDDLADLVIEATTYLNGSAQDIIHPPVYPIYQEGCVILVLGWKQDDWTSVATLGGLTEITDSPTTTGSDQGLVADYLIQTTPTLIGQGTFTVTGGAAAISRAATVALAGGYQTLTLSARSVNGVVKSHTAATRLEIEDAKVLAL